MTGPDNLLGGPPETRLPEDPEARAKLDAGASAAEVARDHPTYSLAWAMLAEEALDTGRDLEGYAFARVGYHRGLDGLRRSGWKGHGPIPWEHQPNRGFLRSLAALARAAAAIGETAEADRCTTFVEESSATAAKELRLP